MKEKFLPKFLVPLSLSPPAPPYNTKRNWFKNPPANVLIPSSYTCSKQVKSSEIRWLSAVRSDLRRRDKQLTALVIIILPIHHQLSLMRDDGWLVGWLRPGPFTWMLTAMRKVCRGITTDTFLIHRSIKVIRCVCERESSSSSYKVITWMAPKRDISNVYEAKDAWNHFQCLQQLKTNQKWFMTTAYLSHDFPWLVISDYFS